MKTDEKVALGVGGVLLAAVTGALFWWWPRGDKKEKDTFDAKKKEKRAKKKAEGRKVFIPSDKKCDGVAYNKNLHPDPASVVASMQKLGYTLSSLQSAKGYRDVKALQRRGRELGLRGMKGKSDSWIDGIVGACTLLTLEDALKLEAAGKWKL